MTDLVRAMALVALIGCGSDEPPPREARTPPPRPSPCAAQPEGSCWRGGMAARWDDPDPVRARTLFAAGCGDGEALACLAWGDLARDGERRDLPVAGERYGEACRLGLHEGCVLQQDVIAQHQVEARCPEDVHACREACARSHDPTACGHALPALAPACDDGDAAACTLLGTLLTRGVGTDADPAEANRLLWRGCDLDDAWGCLRLGANLDAGFGTNPSGKSRGWLRQQVCDLQLFYGCAPHPG